MDKILVTPEDIHHKLSDTYTFWGSNRTPSKTFILRGAPLKIPLDDVVIEFEGEYSLDKYSIEVHHKNGLYYLRFIAPYSDNEFLEEQAVYAKNKGDVWKSKSDESKEMLERVFPNESMYNLIEHSETFDVTWSHEVFAKYLLIMRYIEAGRFEAVKAKRHHKAATAKGEPVDFDKVYMTPIVKTKYLSEIAGQGHHASPQGEFSVRGHWRRTPKSGKRIWVAQYTKGVGGQTRKRVYKL